MRLAPGLAFALATSALLLALVPACSGSTAGVGGGADAGVPGDAAVTDSAADPDASETDSGSVDAAVKDSGIVVSEKPAPECHDLTQRGALIAPIGNPGSPPAQVPITTVAPGLYVLVSTTDYGGATPVGTPASITVAFTASRQYYLQGSTGTPQALTLDWKIADNRLIRKIICASTPSQVGTVVDYRIDGAPNGFIVYVPMPSSGSTPRTEAFRYVRMD